MARLSLLAFLGCTALLAMPVSAQNFARHDSSKPIEITADSLEVLQKDERAVFSGNVVAEQGRMRLAAEEMQVYYRSGKRKANQQSVSRIEVKRNVRLATPQESATGDNGVYDVDANIVTLTGNVVLSKGENVVKGEKLKYNVSSGKSQIGGGADVKTGKTGNGRVRGVFLPQGK